MAGMEACLPTSLTSECPALKRAIMGDALLCRSSPIEIIGTQNTRKRFFSPHPSFAKATAGKECGGAHQPRGSAFNWVRIRRISEYDALIAAARQAREANCCRVSNWEKVELPGNATTDSNEITQVPRALLEADFWTTSRRAGRKPPNDLAPAFGYVPHGPKFSNCPAK
jgi:hypothetical protein